MITGLYREYFSTLFEDNFFDLLLGLYPAKYFIWAKIFSIYAQTYERMGLFHAFTGQAQPASLAF